jgi:hypothetical protein
MPPPRCDAAPAEVVGFAIGGIGAADLASAQWRFRCEAIRPYKAG